MNDFRTTLEGALTGRYTLERELGGGGMSRTYLAREHALDRRVVVKVLAPELLQGLSIERFKREVLLAAQLQHPHVVPVLSAGDADGLPWFTMPYVDGESLRQRLDRGPVPVAEAVSILRDVARALAYAHTNGIVHRDIKPDNVLLSSGSATVTDFGIAKAITASRTATEGATLTQAGTAIGTPAYMAPEQAAGDPALDHRADLYSFGAMAWELLSGRQLFGGMTPAQTLGAHLFQQPEDLRAACPQAPDALAALVMHCLAKEPGDRPQDATAIVQALDAAAGGVSGASLSGVARTPALPSAGRALATWAAIGVTVMLATWAATEFIGLPDWALYGAGALVLAGLPAVGLTWWVQRTARRASTATPTRTPGGTVVPQGTLATMAMRASPHVSWTRTWRAGAVAIGSFAVLVVAFLGTRAAGIGPAASLMGQGAFGERETIVVADFAPPADDTLLGVTIGEALRTDLGQSPNLRVLTRASVSEILQRMLRPPETVVLFPVAREIATREGARAVVDGAVTRLGSGYVLSARLVSALDGAELATFRETADGSDDLLATAGDLSRAIRARVGESLRGIRQSTPVERVTTASLPALRRYMEGIRAEEAEGNYERSLELLEDAVAIDSGFAMAWRKIAVVRSNARMGREEVIAAITQAWRHRDRLSEEELAITEGTYYRDGPEPDARRSLAAYERLIARDSTNRTALNNAANTYSDLGFYEKAAPLYRRAITAESPFPQGFVNYMISLIDLGVDSAVIDSFLDVGEREMGESNDVWELRAWADWAKGNDDAFYRMADSVSRNAKSFRQTFVTHGAKSTLAMLAGRHDEALDELTERTIAQARVANWSSTVMPAGLDSAFGAVVFDGEPERARALLRRALSPTAVDGLPAADRNWLRALETAALIDDSVTAARALEGYERDLRPIDGLRIVTQPAAEGLAHMANGEWDAALSQYRLALSQVGEPTVRQRFFVGLAHDRANRPDSAIRWYEEAVARRTADPGGAGDYWPVMHRRLAEIHDERGDLAKAIEHYEWLAEQWRNADADKQAQVRAWRSRAEELRRRLTPG